MEKINKALSEGQFEKVIELLRDSNANHYEKVYIEAQALIGLGKLEEAMDLVAEELKMPYIPMEHDKKFNDLFDQIIVAKRQSSGAPLTNYTIDQIASILENENDFEMLINAIVQLKDYNVRNLIEVIKDFLKDDTKNSIAKTLLVEVLQNQAIEDKVIISKNGKKLETQVTSLVPVLESDVLAICSSHLENNLAKDPSKLEFCYQSLDNLMFDTFPFLPEINEAKTIAWAIESYVNSLFGQEAPVPGEAIDISKAKKYIDLLLSY